MRRLGRGVAIAATAALLGAAGCGGGAQQGGTSQHPFTTADLVLAAKRTQSAGSARMALSFRFPGLTAQGNGYFDFRGRRGKITMTLTGATIREVFDFPRVYIEMPPQASSQLPQGKRWVMVDLQKATGGALGGLAQSNDDPSQTLDRLRAAGSVRRVGHGTVRGDPTTHYLATIDLRKAISQAPPKLRPFVRRQIERTISMTRHAKLPIDVWIDGSHRVRRERFSIPTPQGTMALDMTLYDFGARQSVTPPPASQTVDMSQRVGQAIQSGGAGG